MTVPLSPVTPQDISFPRDLAIAVTILAGGGVVHGSSTLGLASRLSPSPGGIRRRSVHLLAVVVTVAQQIFRLVLATLAAGAIPVVE